MPGKGPHGCALLQPIARAAEVSAGTASACHAAADDAAHFVAGNGERKQQQ
jgi:hypothetical protein